MVNQNPTPCRLSDMCCGDAVPNELNAELTGCLNLSVPLSRHPNPNAVVGYRGVVETTCGEDQVSVTVDVVCVGHHGPPGFWHTGVVVRRLSDQTACLGGAEPVGELLTCDPFYLEAHYTNFVADCCCVTEQEFLLVVTE